MRSSPSSHPLAHRYAAAIRARRLWQWLLFVLVAVVCYLALSPQPPKELDLGWDKLNHVSAFAALAVAGCIGYPGSRRRVWVVLVGLLALGGLIEIVQYFIPSRSCEWGDLAADSVGITCGATLALIALRLARRASA